ncbi:MAG TPA: type II secretion system F family protein [Actinomycetota bacterium]|nr:type II secretion system F family protein [Actinomycetota bacterium]
MELINGIPVVATVALFGAMILAFANLESYVLERHEAFKTLRRLRQVELSTSDIRRKELSRPFAQRVMIPMLHRFGLIGRKFTPASVVDRLTHELGAAGTPANWDAERVLALKVLGAVAGALAPLAMVPLASMAPARALVLSAILGVLGWYIPEWGVRSRSGKRQAAIRRALPDALDLLSITVEAGLGFDAAVKRVARQCGGPLGEELHRMLQEMQIGKPRAEALRDLGDRNTLPELKSFVLAMVQADIFGISIGKVLHVQAEELRLRRRQLAEEKAQKIPVKIVFPLIACIFPALFCVIMGPAVITIYQSFGK